MKKLTLVGVIALGLMLGGCTSELDHEDFLPQEEITATEQVEVEEVIIEEMSELDKKLTEYAENNNGKYSEYLKMLTITETMTKEAYRELGLYENHDIYRAYVASVKEAVGTDEGYEIRIKFVDEETGNSIGTVSQIDIQATRDSHKRTTEKAIAAMEKENDTSNSTSSDSKDPLANAGLTLTNFNKFERGMTMEEIEQLFGIGWELINSVTDGDNKQTTYEWKDGSKVVWVKFFNYKSTVATQRNLK